MSDTTAVRLARALEYERENEYEYRKEACRCEQLRLSLDYLRTRGNG